jgi:hypothetical protein
MAGWPRKNERARLYRVAKDDYRMVHEVQEGYARNDLVGTFRGPCTTLCYHDPDKWSVKRDGNDLILIQYEGSTQQTMGKWSILALTGGTVNATDATDEQILQAFLGDEHVYTGEKTRTPGGLHFVELPTPDTWGGSAKRVQWSELPEEWQTRFQNYLSRSPERIRGLWRVGKQPKPEYQTDLEM